MGTRLDSAGVSISKIGLGIEHFVKRSKIVGLSRDENSKLILDEAYKLGVTHYDIVFNFPYFFKVFKEFLKNKRRDITFTSHLGSFYDEKKNGHKLTRSLKKIQYTFEDKLERLDTDYVDIALLQYVRSFEDFEEFVNKGVLDYAYQLKKEGKAKAVGLSSHSPKLLNKIISMSNLDVIMIPINFATGFRPQMKQLLQTCKKEGIGVIAIKNLLKGKAFTTRTSDYGAYYTGGQKFSLKLDKAASPADCMNYALNLGVDSVVFGVTKADEVRENMESFKSQGSSDNYKYYEKVFKQKIEELSQ